TQNSESELEEEDESVQVSSNPPSDVDTAKPNAKKVASNKSNNNNNNNNNNSSNSNNNNNNNNSLNDNNTRKSSIQSKDKKKQADDEDDDEKQKEHDNFMEKEFQASQIRRVVSFSLTKSKNQKKKFFKKKSRMIEKRNVIRDRDVTGDKWSKEDFDDVSKEMEEELNRLVKKVYNFFFVTKKKKKKESLKGNEIAALLTPHNNGIMDSQALDNEDNRTVIENFNSLLDGQAFGDTTNRVDSPI
ncbi:hypothetical protein RFI_38757, partial [Reticulomyxa filosa]